MSSSSFTCIKFRENQTSHYNQIEPNPSHQMITSLLNPDEILKRQDYGSLSSKCYLIFLGFVEN